MNEMNDLRCVLAAHGFAIASEHLEIRPQNVSDILASWKDYPRSMDKYPKVITGRRVQ